MAAITDGSNGNSVAVTEENMMLTKSLHVSHISHHSHESHHENAFIIYGKHNIVAEDTNENAFHLKYTGSQWLVIDNIILSTDATDNMTVEFFFDPVTQIGGRELQPFNANRASSNTLLGEFHDSNGGATPIVVSEVGKEFMDLKFSLNSSPYNLDFKQAIYLPTNSELLIIAKSPTIGNKLRINMFVFEDEKD